MKKVITILGITLLMVSCKEEKQLEYDNIPAFLSDTTTLVKGESYYQKIESPTRGTSVLIDIKNTNDTAKTFVVIVKEID